MAVKLIAMDLDGTLLNSQKVISPENQRALEIAVERGIKLAVSTGRALETIPSCVMDNPVFSYAITSNGAEIYRLDTGELLHAVNLMPDSVDAVLAIIGERPVGWEAFMEGKAFGDAYYVQHPWEFGIPSSAIGYIKKTRVPVENIKAFVHENRDHMAVLDLVVEEPELRRKIFRDLRESGEPLYVTASMDQRIEILHQDAGKAAGIRRLCELEGIDPKETAAFGDADNDLDMILLAGAGIAMGNAAEHVKEQADFITGDNDHHGVGEAFRKVLGIISLKEQEQHETFMREALHQAEKANALDEVPIGAVIVKDGTIISEGYNRRNIDNNTLSHAELNAIRKASKKLGDWRLEGCTMYITLEPCQMCAGALVQSRIDRIVLGAKNPKAGCAGSVMNLLQVKAFNHQVEIVDGILEEACSEQLSEFFQKLRTEKECHICKNE